MLSRLVRISATCWVLMLAGCSSVQSTFDAHGPASHSIAGLPWFMTILFLVIAIIMWILVGFAFYRRRGSLATHEPIDAGGGQMWITIGGLAIPLLVLTVLFVFGLQLLRDFPHPWNAWQRQSGSHAAQHEAGDSHRWSPVVVGDSLSER